MGNIIKKLRNFFTSENDERLSILDIKPQYSSTEEYLAALKTEINKMLSSSGKTEDQVYEYIEKSNVYNEELESIYSKLHTYNALMLRQKV